MWRSDQRGHSMPGSVQTTGGLPSLMHLQPMHHSFEAQDNMELSDMPYEPPMELVRMLTDVDDEQHGGMHSYETGMLCTLPDALAAFPSGLQKHPSKRARTSTQSLASESHDHSSSHSANAPSPEQAGSNLAVGSKQLMVQGTACKLLHAAQHGSPMEHACSQPASPVAFGRSERQHSTVNLPGASQQQQPSTPARSPSGRKPDVCKQLDMLIEQAEFAEQQLREIQRCVDVSSKPSTAGGGACMPSSEVMEAVGVATRIISELMRMGTKLGITVNGSGSAPNTPRAGATNSCPPPAPEPGMVDDVAATALAASSGNPAAAVMDLLYRVVKRKLASLRALRAAAAANQQAAAMAAHTAPCYLSVPPVSPASHGPVPRARPRSWAGAAAPHPWAGVHETNTQPGLGEHEWDAMAVLRHTHSMGAATRKTMAVATDSCMLGSIPVPAPSACDNTAMFGAPGPACGSPDVHTPPEEHASLPTMSHSHQHTAFGGTTGQAGSPGADTSSGPGCEYGGGGSGGRLKRQSSDLMDSLLAATWPGASRQATGLTAREILGTTPIQTDAGDYYTYAPTPGAPKRRASGIPVSEAGVQEAQKTPGHSRARVRLSFGAQLMPCLSAPASLDKALFAAPAAYPPASASFHGVPGLLSAAFEQEDRGAYMEHGVAVPPGDLDLMHGHPAPGSMLLQQPRGSEPVPPAPWAQLPSLKLPPQASARPPLPTRRVTTASAPAAPAPGSPRGYYCNSSGGSPAHGGYLVANAHGEHLMADHPAAMLGQHHHGAAPAHAAPQLHSSSSVFSASSSVFSASSRMRPPHAITGPSATQMCVVAGAHAHSHPLPGFSHPSERPPYAHLPTTYTVSTGHRLPGSPLGGRPTPAAQQQQTQPGSVHQRTRFSHELPAPHSSAAVSFDYEDVSGHAVRHPPPMSLTPMLPDLGSSHMPLGDPESIFPDWYAVDL